MGEVQIFSAVVAVAGGLALFLHGLEFSSQAFRKGVGAAARNMMALVCRRRGYAFSFGLVLALLTQSTTAATSFAVGLVDLGMIPFAGSLLVMMGASVGTTFIVFLLSLNVTAWSPLGLAVGVVLVKSGRPRAVKVGYLLQGVSLVLMGMGLIGMGVTPLRQAGVFERALIGAAGHPMMMFLISLALTALVQSSVPVLGLVMTLTAAGVFPESSVLVVVLGSRVGNSAMVVLTGLGTRKNARALALATVIFRGAGVLAIVPFAGPLMRTIATLVANPVDQVSWTQFVVGWLNVIVVLPFTALLGALAQYLVGSRGEDVGTPRFIDPDNVPVPALGVPLLAREMARLAAYADEILFLCGQKMSPRLRARLDQLAVGVPELSSACLSYLTALGDENEDPGLRREHVALAYSMNAMEDLNRVLLTDFVPLCPAMLVLAERDDDDGDLWRRLMNSVTTLLRNALAAFVLDEGAMFRATMKGKEDYRRLALVLRAQMAEQSGRKAMVAFDASRFLMACDRLARSGVELARSEVLKSHLRESSGVVGAPGDGA